MTLSVLYIGGTGQISLPCVEASAAAGHKVTVLNRGKTSVPLPKGVEALVGDMNDNTYGTLGDRHFDVVAQFRLYAPGQSSVLLAVQAHPSAVTFPGPDGESMPDMQHRAVAAVRDWNARLGQDATYLICSHGDVIKAIVADSLGLHLDQCQRIQADPCSLTVIRYTPLRPFLVRMTCDRGGGVYDLLRHTPGDTIQGARDITASDAAVGGGSGGAGH